MIKCEFEDGKEVFLRHVVVDVIITNKEKILLARRAAFLSNPGKLCLPGGFLDQGEKISDAVKREVREETGYEIKNLIHFAVNDNPNRKGEDRQNVSFIFIAEAGEKLSETDQETTELIWADIKNLPSGEEFAFDHYSTVQQYLKYLEEKFSLPVFISESISS